MTLYYYERMLPASPTVFDGAVRGLKCKCDWVLFVSDPESMGVTHFRLTRELLDEAREAEINTSDPKVGTAFLKWLLQRESCSVEKLDSEGRPVAALRGG